MRPFERAAPFPDSFLFGVSISDHQSEAYDERFPPDNWDIWERRRDGVVPRRRATDFWNRWKEDIDNAHKLGCRAFRFSIAWARVEPRPAEFDQNVLDHYREMVEYMRGVDIEPIVTLCHFVWPQHVEERGGLRSHDFVSWFATYTAHVRSALDPHVQYWITFNEPNILLQGFYKFWFQSDFLFPPGHGIDVQVIDEIESTMSVIRHLFMAHSAAREALRRDGGEHNLVSSNSFQLGLPLFAQRLIDRNMTRLKEAEDWRQQFWRVAERPTLFDGRVDVIIAAADDVKTKDYDVAYFISGPAVLVKRDSALDSIDALNGQHIAVVRGGPWEHVAALRARLGDSQLDFYDDYEQALDLLLDEDSRVTALIADHVILNALAHMHAEYRVLDERFSHYTYAIAIEAGHPGLLDAIQMAIRELQTEPGWIELCQDCFPSHTEETPPRFDSMPHEPMSTMLGRIQKRGRVIVGVQHSQRSRWGGLASLFGRGRTPRTEHHGKGLEHFLGRALAGVIFGDPSLVEFRHAKLPRTRPLSRRLRDRLDGWLQAWTIFSTFVSSSWWYLGMDGRLPEYLCPPDCVGQLDFVTFDYYFGVNALTPWQLKKLGESAQRKFDQAALWPEGLHQTLNYYHKMFPDLPIIIAENGFADEPMSKRRGEKIKRHVQAVQRAVNEGVDVRAYCLWSITSNREWGLPQESASDFGLYFVDMDGDPDLKRQETPGLEAYRKLIENRGVG